MTQNPRVHFRRAIAGYHVGDVRRLLSLLELRAEEAEKEIQDLRAQLLEYTVAVESLSGDLAQRRQECEALRDESERARAALRVLRLERNALAARSEASDRDDRSSLLEKAPNSQTPASSAAALRS